MSDVRCRGPLSSAKNLSDFLDRVPIARRCSGAELSLDDLVWIKMASLLSRNENDYFTIATVGDVHGRLCTRSGQHFAAILQSPSRK